MKYFKFCPWIRKSQRLMWAKAFWWGLLNFNKWTKTAKLTSSFLNWLISLYEGKCVNILVFFYYAASSLQYTVIQVPLLLKNISLKCDISMSSKNLCKRTEGGKKKFYVLVLNILLVQFKSVLLSSSWISILLYKRSLTATELTTWLLFSSPHLWTPEPATQP